MATLSTNGLEGLEMSLRELAQLPDDVASEMLFAEAAVIERAQRQKGEAYGVHRTGVTLSSITHGKVKTEKDGKSVYVYPRGTNKNGARNSEVAFVNEYGKKGQPPRPFIRDANEAAADEAVDQAEKIYRQWQDKNDL